jgi:hypothetical protein
MGFACSESDDPSLCIDDIHRQVQPPRKRPLCHSMLGRPAPGRAASGPARSLRPAAISIPPYPGHSAQGPVSRPWLRWQRSSPDEARPRVGKRRRGEALAVTGSSGC